VSRVPDALLAAVLDALADSQTARFDRVTVGGSAVLAELERTDGDSVTRSAGLAHRPPGPVPDAPPWERRSPREFAAAVVQGAADRDEDSTGNRLTRAVAVATLNALSAPHVAWRTGDPMAHLDPGVAVVVTVGLFRPAFRKFRDVEVRVVERERVGGVDAPDGVAVRAFTPDETAAAMAGADVVFVTGSTLVYGGIEGYLAAAPASATVVCVGATASLLPGPFFDAGVDVLAGAAVEDADAARAAVAAGACGTDLHDSGVRKVYVARDRHSDLGV